MKHQGAGYTPEIIGESYIYFSSLHGDQAIASVPEIYGEGLLGKELADG